MFISAENKIVMITLVQLEYIIAVDTYRHFAQAADKCFVTQPTLSMQIKKLEDYLDVVIFDRSKQPIIPTKAGERIIEQARRVLAEANRITEIVDDINNKIEGDLIIGVIPSLAPYILPLFIGEFTRRYPGVNVIIKELLTNQIIDQLKKDTIDVGLLVTPLNDIAITERILLYEEIVVYHNRDHNFAGYDFMKPEDTVSPDIWLLSEGHCFRSQAVNLCSIDNEENNNNLRFRYESGSLETIKKMVESEGGFTLLPELAVSEGMAHIKHFMQPVPLREVSLAYSRNFAKIRLLELLEQTIKESVPPKMLKPDRGDVVEWR